MLEYSFIIITHFVSDWILQPRAIARRKSSSALWMGQHLLIILVATTFLFIFIETSTPIWKAIFYTIMHGLQDKYLWQFYEMKRGPYSEEFLRYNKYAEDYWWYFTIAIDQIIHLLLLFYLYNLWR